MRILPPLLAPWRDVIERRHDPPAGRGRSGYRAYRSCLRWEFGFTCPFCLCHEADFAPRGAEGLGITQVEHLVPVSHDPTGTNVYTNCFYSCRYCNRDRGATANVESPHGRRLLNPSNEVWAEHFMLAGDAIDPREGSEDAGYTHGAYNLNHPRKVEMRRFRRETIEECLDLLGRGRTVLSQLLERAQDVHEPELVDQARLVEDAMRRAWRDLEVFEVVPWDAQSPCACGDEDRCVIPKVLEEQTIEVEPPFAETKPPR